jgi:ATP-dependent Clp protease adapter protein ClpS|tara:strand:+ start:1183 stop:1434 length:252 start_codon:yes stop_codon:yes gene_type:complete
MTYGERKKTLYLLNDNVNSFMDVINVLKKYMSYPTTQGQSIANIVHTTGRCNIFTGDELIVDHYYELFIKNGFNVEVDYYEED